MKKKLDLWLNSEGMDRFLQTLFLIFIGECVIGSSGRWLEIGPLSIRIVLFILCFVLSLPAVFRNIRKLAHNFQLIVTIIYGLYLILCAWIGLRMGNKSSFIRADLTSVMTLALVPGFMSVMCGKKAIERAVDVIFWSATALAGITIALHFVVAFVSNEAVNAINIWINARSLGGLAKLQTGLLRIYFRSQMFLQVAIVYGVWKTGKTKGKKQWLLYLCEGLQLCGCILSYTRGFWLGLAASAVLLLLLGVKHWKHFLVNACAMLTVFAVFVGISTLCYGAPAVAVEIVNRFDPDLIVLEAPGEDSPLLPGETGDSSGDKIEDAVDEANQAAVELRKNTLALMQQRIRQHLLFGNGLGENLDEIRDDGKTEYMYHDQLMKTGVIGMVLFGLTFFGFIAVQIYISVSKRRKGTLNMSWEGAEVRNRFLTAAYIGVAVTSFFNPFLLNPMGITLLLLTSTAVYGELPENSEV